MSTRARTSRSCKQRRDWFSHLKDAAIAMWWVPAGHVPDVAEARERLDHLRAHGPTPFAFPFGAPFPPADAPIGAAMASPSGA